jgi:hypothetical protein
MRTIIRLSRELDNIMRKDLLRQHPFAAERIGFIGGVHSFLGENKYLIILKEYIAIADDNYIEDNTVGARINGNAIRSAMQHIIDTKQDMFHVHMHPFKHFPSMSYTDNKEIPPIIKNFRNVCANSINGILILSYTHYNAYINYPQMSDLIPTTEIKVVGFPFSLNV